ncbi:hypothetical protein RN001_008822 [Aquatica leii]|uniref:Cytochrome P450 n=1 Tax=Aquatica leii TaxID=1421715 RepID=A0AAN7PDU6_9COLE|nr:hypothetical protein RN001_008822 [Aquatica leii]
MASKLNKTKDKRNIALVRLHETHTIALKAKIDSNVVSYENFCDNHNQFIGLIPDDGNAFEEQDTMSVTIILILLVILVFLFKYHWSRRHLYKLAYRLPGPPALPLVGNGLKFLCRHEDILDEINKISADYPKPLRFWLGSILVVYFSCPQHLQKILSSSKLAHKHDVYDLVKIYLGDGLVSNSGEKYKKHRRLIQPLINVKFTSENIKMFQKHIDVYLNKLSKHCGKKTFDVHDLTHHCFADIFGESILGIQMNAQEGKNMDYTHATMEMYTVGYARLMRPWLHIDAIYNRTKGKLEQDRITSITYKFIKNTILKARERVQANASDTNDTSSIIDQIADIIRRDPSVMNDEDFIYHMYTLYCASEDTMTIITSMLCVCFGMYPEYQQRAANEIQAVISKQNTPITFEDLTKMPYLDMCVRDVLRLIPIAPFIVRKLSEDFNIDNITLPKNCGIVVSIFEVHRNPEHWENPNHFHPDHFLPEAVRRRHPFAYVPFSAGPRSCVGKILAFAGLKLTMANVLRRYEIEADGKFPDIVLRSDITVRSSNGYKIRIKERNCI